MKKFSEEVKLKLLKSRLSQLKAVRNRFEDRWKEAQNLAGTSVYDWSNLDSIPELPKRFSSSPCQYLSILTSGLIGYSISPNIVWFKLTLEDQSMLMLYKVKDWLEECEEILNGVFNRSRLYSQAVKLINDSALVGHGVMLITDNVAEQSVDFKTMRINEMYLDCAEDGSIDTVFRTFLSTLRNAVAFFGLENLHKDFQEAYENADRWNDQIEFLHAVYPREDADPDKADSKNMPYASIYVDTRHNVIVKEEGFNENPYAVFEWQQIPGYPYSESPVTGAMTDIRALNVMEETRLKIAQTSAEPPLMLPEGMRNVSIIPKGYNYVKKDQQITPIKLGENYPITLEVVQQKQAEVREWFNVDFFLMLQQQKGRQMTATEVQELQGEKAAVLSSLIVNLNNALSKIITRTFKILMRNGTLPEPPQALIDQSAEMKIDFMGPLAQAQKKYHAMGGLSNAMQLATPIIQMFPNAGDFIDADELIKRAMSGQGMPEAVIREDDDVEKLRQTRAEEQMAAQQQQQQQAMMQSVMQNADRLNQPIQKGSVLQGVNEQLAGGMSRAQ